MKAANRSVARFAPYLILAVAVLLFHRHVLFDSDYTFPWDFRTVHVPLAQFMADSFRARQWPLWNPYMYAGMPVFANIQAASFYPPVVAAALLTAITGIRVDAFVEWDLALHVFLAGVFTYWLLRYLKAGPAAALISALVYALGGFFAAHAEHLGAISGAAWLPLAWLAVLRLFDEANSTWFCVLAASFAMSTLAGLPQLAVSVIASSLMLGAILWIARRRANVSQDRPSAAVLLWMVGAIVFAALLAAVQLIPTLQLTSLSIAQFRAAYLNTGGGVWPPSLLTLLLPDHFGIFDPAKYTGHGDLTFTYFYCGLLGAALAILGAIKKSSAPFVTLTLACALWMLGDSTWIGREVFVHLPVSIRIAIHPEYMMCAFLLCLAILAGLGAQYVASHPTPLARSPLTSPILVAILALDLLLTSSARPMNHVSRLADPGVDSEQFSGSRELLDSVRKLSWAATPPWRIDVNDRSLLAWAVESPLTRVPTADGHDPLALERIIQVRLAFAHGYRWGSSYPIENLRSPVIDLLNARYILSRAPIDPSQLRGSSLTLAATLPGHFVYENKNVLPRFFFVTEIHAAKNLDDAESILHAPDFDPHRVAIVESPPTSLAHRDLSPGNVEVRSYTPSHIELETNAPAASFLVCSDANYPGWQAFVDGQPSPLYFADVAFRGIPLTAGRHSVALRFVPHILDWSAALTALAWLLAALLWRGLWFG